MTETDEPNLIGTGRLAHLLDISRQRVSQLVSAGVLTRKGRGQFELDTSIRSYVAYLRSQPFGTDGSGGALDYAAERTRLTKLQADKVAEELAIMRGKTVAIEDVVEPFAAACSLIRTKFLGLAARCAPLVSGLDEKGAFRILQNAIVEILTELSTDIEMRERAELAAGGDQ